MHDNKLSKVDNILYLRLTKKYVEEACAVIRQTTFTSGPVSATIGLYKDPEALAEIDQILVTVAKDGLSIIAVDKNTNKIVGAVFNKILVKSQPFFETFQKSFKNSKSRTVVESIIYTDNICNIFEHCKINCVMEVCFLGTLPEYRGRGIAKKLAQLSIDLAESLKNRINIKVPIDGEDIDLEPVPEAVYATFSSQFSQKIGRALGFEVAAERNTESIEFNGEVLKNPASVTSTITVEYKILHETQ